MLNDNILVKKCDSDNKTATGLIIPESIKNYAIVEIVKVPEELTVCDAGDKIYIPKYAGTEIKIEGEDYLIITSKEIILKL